MSDIKDRINKLKEAALGFPRVDEFVFIPLLAKDPLHPENGVVDEIEQEQRLKVLNEKLRAQAAVPQAIKEALQGETTAVQLKAMSRYSPEAQEHQIAWQKYDRQKKAGIPTARPPNFPRPNSEDISQSAKAGKELAQSKGSNFSVGRYLEERWGLTNDPSKVGQAITGLSRPPTNKLTKYESFEQASENGHLEQAMRGIAMDPDLIAQEAKDGGAAIQAVIEAIQKWAETSPKIGSIALLRKQAEDDENEPDPAKKKLTGAKLSFLRTLDELEGRARQATYKADADGLATAVFERVFGNKNPTRVEIESFTPEKVNPKGKATTSDIKAVTALRAELLQGDNTKLQSDSTELQNAIVRAFMPFIKNIAGDLNSGGNIGGYSDFLRPGAGPGAGLVRLLRLGNSGGMMGTGTSAPGPGDNWVNRAVAMATQTGAPDGADTPAVPGNAAAGRRTAYNDEAVPGGARSETLAAERRRAAKPTTLTEFGATGESRNTRVAAAPDNTERLKLS